MSRPLIVRPRAEADIADAQGWYNGQREGLGDEFVLAVREAVRRIRRSPVTRREVYPGVRRVLTVRFPYAVYYVAAAGHIAVIAVYHTRRDPAGWQDRVAEEE